MVVSAIVERVRGALKNLEVDCPMEEVVGLCPELTWNQVFLAIDYLSRVGEVQVLLDSGRTYRVKALHRRAGSRFCLSGPARFRSAVTKQERRA
jgi:hypothetical protein